MVIKAISFDADQTLWDFRGVMQRALQLVSEEIARRYPQVVLTAEDLQEVREAVAVTYRGRPHSLEDVRAESFQVALEGAGIDPDEAAVESQWLVQRYLDMRFQEIELYPDVVPALDALRGRCRLALISNGNTDPERCGLPGYFDTVVLGPDHGIEKPHPRAFELAAAELGIETTELVHVGDDRDDVIGANGVGAVSVLIDRGERAVDRELLDVSGFAITTLAELPAVLASLA